MKSRILLPLALLLALAGVSTLWLPNRTAEAVPTATTRPIATLRPMVRPLERDLVLMKLNEERLRLGLSQFQDDISLSSYAATRSVQISEQWEAEQLCTHDGFREMDLGRTLERTVAEIIVCQATNSEDAVFNWLASPTHAAAIRDPLLTSISLSTKGRHVVAILASNPNP